MGRSIQYVITLHLEEQGKESCTQAQHVMLLVGREQKVKVLDNQGERGVTNGEISEDSMDSGAIVMANNRISWLFLFAN